MSMWGRKCDAACSRAEIRDKHFQVRPIQISSSVRLPSVACRGGRCRSQLFTSLRGSPFKSCHSDQLSLHST
jgi:hypothetical protein